MRQKIKIMKRLLFTLSILAISQLFSFAQEAKNEIDFLKEEKNNSQYIYNFSVTYRIQIGYLQQWQHSTTNSYPKTHLYGPELGITFDFNLPYNFSLQTGLMYGLTYGTNTQHWKNISQETSEQQYIKHKLLNHQLSIPILTTYNIKLWRELSMILYTGPELSVGISQNDYLETNLNDATKNWLQLNNVKTEKYELYKEKQLYRTNIQYNLGGGLQWDKYRLVGGYKFGLNNLVKQNNITEQQMWNWTINVTFSYAL